MAEQIKVQELDSEISEHLASLHMDPLKFAHFGDVPYTMPMSYKEGAGKFKNMSIRADDVWVVTFPRSGTTWTQELVWLLLNDFDYTMALNVPLFSRYFFLEGGYMTQVEHRHHLDPVLREKLSKRPKLDVVENAPSPRYIRTHLPFSLLPANLLDSTKIVYVARDPRDVAVSYFHHNTLFYQYKGDFKSYWNIFINDLVSYSPYFPHLKEAWALRHHPNMLFIFYEDMIKDLPSCIKRIAGFYGKAVPDEQIVKLCNHLDIETFRRNESVNPSWFKQFNPQAEGFVRKGKPGAWREDFNEEMTAQAHRWMLENLADTDLRFPDV